MNQTPEAYPPSVFASECPSRQVLSHVTSRWGVLALVALLDGTQRFSVLRRRIEGVSEKMLAQTLQILEADGFVDRKSLPVVPPHVEYSLTTTGVEIALQVKGIVEWIEQNLPRVSEAPKWPVHPLSTSRNKNE